MSFAHPLVLLALLLLPLLAGLKLWADARSRKAASRMASERHLANLLVPRARRRDWWVLFFELGALAFFIIALARPQYGTLEEDSGTSGRSLIVGIDTSRSMLTDDLKPNRLVRARLAATDLVKRLRGDRIGLMPFAGSAYMYAPITPDVDALLESIDSLDTEVIPRGGSNLARPIDLALETFAKSEATGQQVLILFSDGENTEGVTLEAAQRAKEKNMTIITIGVGTQSGNLIPDETAPSGIYRDRDGKPVVSKLQRDVLIRIADATDGLYLSLDENGVSDTRIDRILEKLKRTAMKGKLTQKPIDRYRWPLGAGLLLLTAGWIAGIVKPHRRKGPPPLPGSPGAGLAPVSGMLLLLTAGAVFLTSGATRAGAAVSSPSSSAAPSNASSATQSAPAASSEPKEIPVGNPWAFYREGNFEAAQKNFQMRLDPEGLGKRRGGGDPELEFGRGAAAFKTKDYDTAVDAFGQAVLSPKVELRAKAHYNLANSIYERTAEFLKISQRGKKPKVTLSFIDGLIRQLENSLENYQQALALQPGQEDFKANHDTTDELIQKLRKIRQQMADQQKKDGKQKGEGGKEKKKGKKGEGEQEGEGSGPGEGQPGGKGANGEEGEQGSNKKGEGDAEKAAREKSNEDKEGEIGEQGNQGKDGEEDGKGDKKGEGEDGPNGDKPSDSGEGGDPDEAEEADNEVNNETGFSPAEAKRQLELLSDEDTKVRPRIDQAPERRPLKDW